MGGTGTGKSRVVKAVTNIMNETVQNITSVIHLGRTGTAAFLITGTTCNYVLVQPINRTFNYLNEVKPQYFQQCLDGIKLNKMDEITIMVRKILYQVDKRQTQTGKKSTYMTYALAIDVWSCRTLLKKVYFRPL